MIEASDDASERDQQRVAPSGHPVMPWLYGVVALAGLALLAWYGNEDYGELGTIALVCSLPYLVWWAALERASATPRLSIGRRVAACLFTTLAVAACHATMVMAVSDALDTSSDSPTVLGFAALCMLAGAAWTAPRAWHTLADEPQLVCIRRLLAAISGWAFVALALDAFCFLLAQGRGTMLAGLLALLATLAALSILGWTVLPWLRLRWFVARSLAAQP